MRKSLVIAAHTAHQAFRQPLFWILTGCFAAMIWASQFFTMFTLDDRLEGYLLREMGTSSIALCGALLAVLLSWLVISRDMDRLVALTVLSKPVSRPQFLAGKFAGILAAVAFSSAVLAAVLVATVWQKEGSRNLAEYSEIGELAFRGPQGDFGAAVESVEPVPRDRPLRAIVTLSRPLPESATAAERLAACPGDGAFALGQLSVWKDNSLRSWLILRSWNDGGRGRLEISIPQPWLDHDTGAPLEDLAEPGDALAALPPTGDARVASSRHGAAQRAWARFWSFDALQILKGALLAVVRVAVLLAFAASLAPHVPLVVNGAASFVLFLVGHVSNYAFLALDAASQPSWLRWAGRIFYAIFPNLENSRVESLVAAGREISLSYVCWSAGYGLAYAALVLAAGAAFFSRKEIR